MRPIAVALMAMASAAATHAAEFFAGGFSFSDELGGFRLISVTGTGTASDPIVVVEEIPGIEAVTLVIRRHALADGTPHTAHSQLTLVKAVINRSNRVWAGFEVELQEILDEPSVYGDGLSFKQFAASPEDVGSDTFTLNDRRFEPYDRISFQGGSVDPEATARFRLTITDPTPVSEFYLLQDPNLVSAQLPLAGRSVAAR